MGLFPELWNALDLVDRVVFSRNKTGYFDRICLIKKTYSINTHIIEISHDLILELLLFILFIKFIINIVNCEITLFSDVVIIYIKVNKLLETINILNF